MTYLLDTHILLWTLIEPKKLPANYTKIIVSDKYQKCFSIISVWEISLKFALSKLNLKGNKPESVINEAVTIGFQLLPLKPTEAGSFHKLPPIAKHKDPFDRMLVWQAIQNDYILLSKDRELATYDIHGLKVA